MDGDTGKPVVIRNASPDVLVVVGPDMKTVNQLGRPLTVVAGSVLITPGKEGLLKLSTIYVLFCMQKPRKPRYDMYCTVLTCNMTIYFAKMLIR